MPDSHELVDVLLGVIDELIEVVPESMAENLNGLRNVIAKFTTSAPEHTIFMFNVILGEFMDVLPNANEGFQFNAEEVRLLISDAYEGFSEDVHYNNTLTYLARIEEERISQNVMSYVDFVPLADNEGDEFFDELGLAGASAVGGPWALGK